MEANTWFPCVIEKNAGPWTHGGFAPCPEGGWQYGWGLYPNIHNGEELFVTSNKDAWWINARADAIPLNTWTHVAFTCTFVDYKVRDWRIYVNGEEVLLTAANVVGITSQLDGEIYMGDGLTGSIDEIAVFDRVLTPEEIRSCYQDVLEVVIDIKPGSYPNAINLGSQGLIPVAILSSADFDALRVDPSKVSLSGAGVAVKGKGKNTMAHEEDVDADGLLDLVLKIETENLDPDQFQSGWAILTGETFDGQAIEGQDEITIVPDE
jgi:hypothetical protein